MFFYKWTVNRFTSKIILVDYLCGSKSSYFNLLECICNGSSASFNPHKPLLPQ